MQARTGPELQAQRRQTRGQAAAWFEDVSWRQRLPHGEAHGRNRCSALPAVARLARRMVTDGNLVPLRTGPLVAARLPHGTSKFLRDRQARVVRYLRISLTDRCNYRCTYCMPERGIDLVPKAEVLSLEEIVRLCRAFVGWGVERVRLTGGEPTIRRGLVDLVGELSTIPTRDGHLRVAMTSNGELLAELAEPLARAGLRSVTISLDSLDARRFRTITRRGRLERVLAGIDAARQAGFSPIKLNTVAIRSFNDDELADLCRFAWARRLVPRFIEPMPMFGGALYVPGSLISGSEVRQRIAAELGAKLVSDAAEDVRGLGPASYWRVVGGSHAGERLGTIAPMTENFCASCNRLRISATGQLHACLAYDDAGDLRAALRSTDPTRLESVVRTILAGKREGHAFVGDGHGGPLKAMVSIGG